MYFLWGRICTFIYHAHALKVLTDLAIKAWENESIAPCILMILNGCEWSSSCPSHFTLGKEPWSPLNIRLNMEKKKLCHCWNLNPDIC
jgi:hypothetical protein